jgi:hypothetical protein
LRDNGKTRAVLSLLQTILNCQNVDTLKVHVQRLATRLVRKYSKILASALTLSNTRLAAIVLTLVSKVTTIGVIQARDCWKRFSMNLSVISKFLEPPKDNVSAKNERMAEQLKTRALVTRSACLSWIVSLLQAGDATLIQTVLEAPNFVGAIFKHLAGDVAETTLAVLETLRSRVMLNTDLSFHVRSMLFTSYNLEQV